MSALILTGNGYQTSHIVSPFDDTNTGQVSLAKPSLAEPGDYLLVIISSTGIVDFILNESPPELTILMNSFNQAGSGTNGRGELLVAHCFVDENTPDIFNFEFNRSRGFVASATVIKRVDPLNPVASMVHDGWAFTVEAIRKVRVPPANIVGTTAVFVSGFNRASLIPWPATALNESVQRVYNGRTGTTSSHQSCFVASEVISSEQYAPADPFWQFELSGGVCKQLTMLLNPDPTYPTVIETDEFTNGQPSLVRVVGEHVISLININGVSQNFTQEIIDGNTVITVTFDQGNLKYGSVSMYIENDQNKSVTFQVNVIPETGFGFTNLIDLYTGEGSLLYEHLGEEPAEVGLQIHYSDYPNTIIQSNSTPVQTELRTFQSRLWRPGSGTWGEFKSINPFNLNNPGEPTDPEEPEEPTNPEEPVVFTDESTSPGEVLLFSINNFTGPVNSGVLSDGFNEIVLTDISIVEENIYSSNVPETGTLDDLRYGSITLTASNDTQSATTNLEFTPITGNGFVNTDSPSVLVGSIFNEHLGSEPIDDMQIEWTGFNPETEEGIHNVIYPTGFVFQNVLGQFTARLWHPLTTQWDEWETINVYNGLIGEVGVLSVNDGQPLVPGSQATVVLNNINANDIRAVRITTEDHSWTVVPSTVVDDNTFTFVVPGDLPTGTSIGFSVFESKDMRATRALIESMLNPE